MVSLRSVSRATRSGSSTARTGGKYTRAQVSKNRKKALIGTGLTLGAVGIGAYALNNIGNKSSSSSDSKNSKGGSSANGQGGSDGTGTGTGGTGTGGDSGHPISDKIAEALGRQVDEKQGYILHLGEILDTYHYANIEDLSYEGDYHEMSENGTIKMGDVDKKRFYKGIRLSVRTNWKEPNAQDFSWKHLDEILLGFITEQTFEEETTELKIDGKCKTLDKKYKFNFSDMKRSEIIREVILCADLIPIIDVEGLDDDVTSFTNVSSSSSSGDDTGDVTSTGSASMDEAVKNAIKGKTSCLDKAKAIDKAFKSHVFYDYYYDVHHPNLDEAWKHAHLNCADGANVLSAMFNSAGISATILHTTGHYIVRVTCNGKSYYTDNANNSGQHTVRPFGQVYGDSPSSGSVVGKKISA